MSLNVNIRHRLLVWPGGVAPGPPSGKFEIGKRLVRAAVSHDFVLPGLLDPRSNFHRDVCPYSLKRGW